MKKAICFLVTIVLLVSGFGAQTIFAAAPKVLINSKPLKLSMDVILKDGRSYFGFREIAEALGAEVSWDDATRTATAKKNGRQVDFTIDSGTYKVDGETKSMGGAAAFVGHGRTYLPIRFLAEALGYAVGWDEPTNTIMITSNSVDVGDIIPFGGYNWIVLEVQREQVLLISKDILEKNTPYHEKTENVTWENCSLRAYLNKQFYNSFGEEKTRIIEKQIINNNNPVYGTLGGANTKDKIFLLSVEEVVKYLGDGKILQNQSLVNDEYNSIRKAKHPSDRESSMWWLRSPGYINSNAASVDADGRVSIMGGQVLKNTGGVRPALWLNL